MLNTETTARATLSTVQSRDCFGNRSSSERFTLCLLIVFSLCRFPTTNTATAATYYVDDTNGLDSNPGTSSLPWKTIGKTQAVAVAGDTVYLADGQYGDFRETNTPRNSWLVYEARGGHHPQLTSISISHSTISDSYLKFAGITVNAPKTNADHIALNKCRYVVFDNVILNGAGCDTTAASNGYALWGAENITIQNSVITGIGTTFQGGFDYGIFSRDTDHITVQNCAIDQCERLGILVDGSHWTIQDCNLFHLDNDGIVISGEYRTADTILISNNKIHDIKPTTYFTDITAANYTESTRSIVVSSGLPYPTIESGEHYVRMTDASGAIITSGTYQWFAVAESGPATIKITAAHTPGRDCSGITKVELKGGAHCDLIQVNYYPANNITIRNNLLYNSERQILYLNPTSGENYTIENNLAYNGNMEGGASYAVTFGNISNIVFRGNTIDGMVYGKGITNSFSGNIVYLMGIDVVGGGVLNGENYNIFGKWYPHLLGSQLPGAHTVVLGDENNFALFKALFTSYEGRDFRLAPSSLAVNFSDPASSPVSDILGVSRNFPPDAGCYEYIATDPNNHAPVLDAIGNKSVSENTHLTFSVSATDADGDTITYSAGTLPSGASFDAQTFRWTPTDLQVGSYQVRFTASDGKTTDSETITITVGNVNRPPVLATIGNESVAENSPLSFSISATDPDGNTITYSAQGLPTGAAFTGRTFTWTPGYTQAGTHQVTFVASDGQAQDSETITITVSQTNQPPVLSSIGNKTVFASDPLALIISATDGDGDTITYSASNLPSGATFGGQSFNWTPTAGQAGTYQATFIAGDGALTDSETITITVRAADTSAPQVSNLSPATDAIQAPLNSIVRLHVADDGKGVNPASVTIRVNNNIVYSGDSADYSSSYGHCRRTGTSTDYMYIYQPDAHWDYDQTVTVLVNASDVAGNTMSQYSYSFVTEMRSFARNRLVSSSSNLNSGKAGSVRDSSGNIWVCWHNGAAGSRDIYVAKLAAAADSFSAPVQITADSADQYNPAMAIDGSDKLYLVWEDNRRGNWDIYASTSIGGTIWSTEQAVTDVNTNETGPAIAIDHSATPKAYVVWQDDRAGNQDIYVASSTDGFVTKIISQVTSNIADQFEPAIASNATNTVYIGWTDMRSGAADIYGAASNSGPWTNVATVTKSNNQTSPALATESTGSILHLLWIDDAAGNKDIYYASSSGLPATPLTGRNLVDDGSGADQVAPALVVSGSAASNLNVFACWQDSRNVSSSGDTDLYFSQVNSGNGTNIFMDDDGTNADQSAPAIGIDRYGHPYVCWIDSRNSNTDIYFAASTFANSTALASQTVSAGAAATIGTDPGAITGTDDVSITMPAGAYPCDLLISIAKVENPLKLPLELLAFPFEFGPSGADFDQPVTITIPYAVTASDVTVSAYWYNTLTGALSQQGITDIETISISPTLRAIRFKTTHFTQFIIAISPAGAGGGGGCSLCPTGNASAIDFVLPYLGLAAAMVVIRHRDVKNRAKRNAKPGG